MKALARKRSTYSDETWAKVEALALSNPDLSLSEIARRFNIPIATIENASIRRNWAVKRDKLGIDYSNAQLTRIIQELALQVNDMNAHARAMIEALQYSHRIRIIRNTDGSLHYQNFEDYPDRPNNWLSLSPHEQEALLTYIPPGRLTRFIQDLLTVLNYKTGVITFVTKVLKGSLPKIDPTMLTLSDRDATEDLINDVDVLTLSEGDNFQQLNEDTNV